MEKYKINSTSDNDVFVVTKSYKNLYNKFKSLKNSRGRIIHVIGAPGTGKSANIYAALDALELNVYDVEFTIKNVDSNSEEVFKEIYNFLKKDTNAKSKEEVYKNLSKFDVLLFADRFHDSHLMDNNNVGFSVWTKHARFMSTKFYLYCIWEYINERKYFKEINIVLQTSWRVYIIGKKYDIFTDLGILSRLIVIFMRILFEVVEISYSRQETLKIVKEHVNVDEKIIEKYIHKYGSKPRFICQALENNE
jgi:Cdc6-like AAA superfamily ATPase